MKNKRILVLDDNNVTRDVIKRNLSAHGFQIYTASNFDLTKQILEEIEPDLLITDLKMPDISGLDVIIHVTENFKNTEIIVITGYPTINSAVDAVKLGANDYLTKPFTDVELLTAVKKALEKQSNKQEFQREISDGFGEKFGIIGKSAKMLEVFKTIKKASQINSTVLITGESGTGKELVARAIHYAGFRAAAPFVPINCGAIPETLLESELFGYVKGAFTGAHTTREGFFQSADKGTIFLDEISETSMMLQIKMLRVIQEKEVYMVGSNRCQKVDVRILVASNKDLFELVQIKKFREDLFYRLNVLTVQIPPLRERGSDIFQLANHFANKYAEEFNKKVPVFNDEVLEIFGRYNWPGNVRELENLVHRLVIMNEDGKISKADLPDFMKSRIDSCSEVKRSLQEVEIQHIKNVLEYTGNNKTKAAEILEIDRKTLNNKLKE
ncbi:MAG: sigma-54 dependent transcriptional regulator [Candidatus Cloacimonetes bacterium]|nr:sigma-54 dependent transcriptional regulator [Candidatus Cloacimonadota bacterium]MCF7812917.1 sigma-54 dependent transcriptional regulator [Candidatus Cloacimonadota bacterium]MCF7867129.1 sigma-54 dependent transcriptional regulator [Candidatus Cloacimonadota bacterium]MCF7882551.1 sigma-54 dependent transcriptional regulator [Candidatus Cloacimonadota bacterium]